MFDDKRLLGTNEEEIRNFFRKRSVKKFLIDFYIY